MKISGPNTIYTLLKPLSLLFILIKATKVSQLPVFTFDSVYNTPFACDGISANSLPLAGRVREGGVKQVIPPHTPLLSAG